MAQTEPSTRQSCLEMTGISGDWAQTMNLYRLLPKTPIPPPNNVNGREPPAEPAFISRGPRHSLFALTAIALSACKEPDQKSWKIAGLLLPPAEQSSSGLLTLLLP